MLPYGKQTIESDDIEAVIEAMNSNWLTTGPMVQKFETAFAKATSSVHAVAVSSGTAALHAAMFAAGIGSARCRNRLQHPATVTPKTGGSGTHDLQDEVIVPAITFVATANAAVYLNAKPVFADVDPTTMLIDPADVLARITDQTRAIVAMDYAGQPCNYAALREIADQYNLILIADACHSMGGHVNQRPVGSLADFTCFSMHPIKQITSGEGGVVTTNDTRAATAMRSFRNHGITTDHHQREKLSRHQYCMESLGFNYRLTDIQCALANSQLKKLSRFTQRRNEIAKLYDSLLEPLDFVQPLEQKPGVNNAYHLYVVQWDEEKTGISRDLAFELLRDRGIGVNVHYQPVYQHPFYKDLLGEDFETCPNAEMAYSKIISLPIFPTISEQEVRQVVSVISEIAAATPELKISA
jgi:perosamine synthetase